jgi:hypothetical protein
MPRSGVKRQWILSADPAPYFGGRAIQPPTQDLDASGFAESAPVWDDPRELCPV